MSNRELPRNPSRDNYARDCELAVRDDLPEHLTACACFNHTGVCDECGFKITIGTSGTEYGHARYSNRDSTPPRVDCPHRPDECNPGRQTDQLHADTGSEELVTDGGLTPDEAGKVLDFDDFESKPHNGTADNIGEHEGRVTTIEPAPEPVDPLADDFEVGDPAIDLANGRSVVIVDKAADRTDDHSEREGYDFEENYGNSRLRTNASDPVYTAVYVNSLQSQPNKSYDFPSSRLGRVEYENVDGVDRVYQMVARDVLERLFGAAQSWEDETPAQNIVSELATSAGLDEGLVDEARELADVETTIGGGSA